MKNIETRFSVLGSNGDLRNVDVIFTDDAVTAEATFEEASEIHTVSGADLFDCLCLLRQWYEDRGSSILCNGARTDVFPSRMSRQMGRGRKAYVLTISKQARKEDLVDIFEPASAESVGTVSEQVAYYETWLDSLQ